MAIEVIMPKYGRMDEATITRVLKSAGDRVAVGEPLCEIETEKVNAEIEAPQAGVLAAFLHGEQSVVPCGNVVAIIAIDGEDPRAVAARYRAGAAGDAAVAPAAPARPDAPPAMPAGSAAGERRAVSPLAKRRAAELGVDLARVVGSGPGGRVTREDVERAAPSSPAAGEPSPSALAAVPRAGAAAQRMRRAIAERMMRSLQHSAQLTLTTEADVTGAVAFRNRTKADTPFTYTDLIVYAVARALPRHPRFMVRADGDDFAPVEEINIGVAVSLDDGLIVPVIRGADRLNLGEIAAANRALVEKARDGRLAVDDVTAGTFTITNLGAYGIDGFTPIINPGEPAILGMGRIVERPLYVGDEIARRAVMTLSLTFDHRLLDGAPAAQFLHTVVELFNAP